jgi:hypothetical protein
MSKSVVLTLLLAGLLSACVAVPAFETLRGSGKTVTRSYDFAGFDSVVISHAFQAEVTMSDRYAVEVTVDDNLVERLRVEQQGQTVRIGFAPGWSASNATLRARITLPRLAVIEASGASRVSLARFKSGDNLKATVSGASTAQGEIATGNLTADVSGASKLTLRGSGKRLDIKATGASTADLRDFAGADAAVEAGGASRINVNVTGKLDANASGASHVRYTGRPTLGRIDESGASSISAQ